MEEWLFGGGMVAWPAVVLAGLWCHGGAAVCAGPGGGYSSPAGPAAGRRGRLPFRVWGRRRGSLPLLALRLLLMVAVSRRWLGVCWRWGAVFVYAVPPPCLLRPAWGCRHEDGGLGAHGGLVRGCAPDLVSLGGGGTCDACPAGGGSRRRLRLRRAVGGRTRWREAGVRQVISRGADATLRLLVWPARRPR